MQFPLSTLLRPNSRTVPLPIIVLRIMSMTDFVDVLEGHAITCGEVFRKLVFLTGREATKFLVPRSYIKAWADRDSIRQ
jgi:hypothetical protein